MNTCGKILENVFNTYTLYCNVMLYLKDENSNISNNINYNNKHDPHSYAKPEIPQFFLFASPSLLCLSFLRQALTL